jgi:uroporphyrinogen III methyltransferase/synthase
VKRKGIVYLVGAGPGDPQLLTLRGADLLRRADVVVYDALVNPELLRHVPPQAERVLRDPARFATQEALTAFLVEQARAGRTVVRLKGGDPYVFGRGGEEAMGLVRARVPCEVVPGVTSVTAALNYAGIPLTHRDHCSSFTVVTGHAEPGSPNDGVDWPQLARTAGTKVILMGAERVAAVTATLQAHGLDPRTPAAAVHWGTLGRQRSVAGTLATLAAAAAAARIAAPAILVIGSVVTLRDQLNWFEHLPLFGQRVVVTRNRDQAGEFAQRLREAGAAVLEVPCLKFLPPTRREPVVEALSGLGSYDWIVFTSANGVATFFDYFFRAFADLRDLGAVRIAAVGPATAARLAALHLKVDVTPKEALARNIVTALTAHESLENLRVLLPRAEVATPDLPRLLEEQGAIVDDIPFYRTAAETEDDTGGAATLAREGADWIAFSSASTVENFHARFDLPELRRRFPGLRLASIGPETSKALAQLALKPDVEARTHTTDGLIEGIGKAARAAR